MSQALEQRHETELAKLKAELASCADEKAAVAEDLRASEAEVARLQGELEAAARGEAAASLGGEARVQELQALLDASKAEAQRFAGEATKLQVRGHIIGHARRNM